MKITINQQTLIHTLELITRVSIKHVTLPVLQCVLITVKDGNVTFKATNLEISIEVTNEAQIETDGVVAVSATTLLQAVQYITKKEVVLSVVDGVVVVDSGSGKTTINTMPYDEFPSITKLTTPGATIQKNFFALGVKTVSFAASQSSIKPELGSIYIQQKKEHSLTFVATDSFRLMEKTVPQKNFVLDQTLLIPQKNAVELARICDLLESDPTLIITENQCALAFSEGVYITSRLISGSFPDYEQIIPKEYSTHTTVLKNDLLQAFKKTHVFLNKFMQVTLNVTSATLVVSSQNGEVGTTTDTVPVQTTGNDLLLNFNQQYLIDPLTHISDESLVLHFAGIGRPLVIQGASDTTLRYLVMPMNK
jgi:DNA polymerase III subunit beta